MDDLKKLSLEALRELARKHLGKGHSRLRTKAQLLEALKDAVRQPLSRLLEAAESVVPGAGRVRVVEFPPGRKGRVRADRTSGKAAPAEDRAARPAGKKSAPGGRGARRAPPATVAGPRVRGRAARAREEAPEPEPPVEEAFFEVPAVPRRPRRTLEPPAAVVEEPITLPREVGTDAPVLLVRDPVTLFAFWDFRRELERGAALGLREPRLLLRIYRGEDLERSLELPLAARSAYVTGLRSGQEYTAEVLLLGRDGWTRPVGSRSTARRLPPGRASERLEVRTLRLPWSQPLSEVPTPSAPELAWREPLDSPRRVPLPTSPGARGPDSSSGGRGSPRSGRN